MLASATDKKYIHQGNVTGQDEVDLGEWLF